MKGKTNMIYCRGCSKTINILEEFKDIESKVEFTISGLCQECQDKVFTEE